MTWVTRTNHKHQVMTCVTWSKLKHSGHMLYTGTFQNMTWSSTTTYPPEVQDLSGASEGVLGVWERGVQEEVTQHLRVVVHGRRGHPKCHWKVELPVSFLTVLGMFGPENLVPKIGRWKTGCLENWVPQEMVGKWVLWKFGPKNLVLEHWVLGKIWGKC